MNTLTRRRFLIASGTAGVAAAAAGAGLVGWHTLAQRATADPLPPGSRILVIVTLYGGNDGLNTGSRTPTRPITAPGPTSPTPPIRCISSTANSV